jgi:hypothetical protein
MPRSFEDQENRISTGGERQISRAMELSDAAQIIFPQLGE